jgi:hypothetical protein
VGGIVADRKVTPSINNFLILGKNTLGGPSGMFSLASCYEPYETRLRMLVDVYQYQEMIENFGLPTIFPDAYIEYGVGAWQVQKSVDSREYVNELSFIFGNSASAKTYSRELLTSKGDFELKILTLRALFKTGELSLLIFSLNFCLLKFKFQFSRFKNKLHQFF